MDFLVEWLAGVVCKSGNWLIVALAVLNGMVGISVKCKIKKAEEMFNPKSDRVNGVVASMKWSNKEISDLKKIRKEVVVRYAWYANITAIFPLLGILGTVAALVTYSNETMMDNFMIALGTTLLGVFFAIVFKIFDAKISGPLDVIVEDADSVIQDYNLEKRNDNEA